MEKQKSIRRILSISQVGNHGKYLGLPTFIGKSKKEVFGILREWVWKKLQGRKEKLLSKAGKEVLIKAVAQAIPIYAMSCFKIPLSLCEEIKTMINNFWWGQRASERKIHWLCWESLCYSKKDGGLGFRDFPIFDNALLAKQAWRLISNENSLVARLLKAKYFPRSIFLDLGMGVNPSYSWRSMWEAKDVLGRGVRWWIGNGRSVGIWKDKWLPTPTTFRVVSLRNMFAEDTWVSELIDAETKEWFGRQYLSTS